MMRIIKQSLPSFLVLSVILIAIGLTLFSPLYQDEFSYKLFLERFFINGGFKQSVTPFCPEGFLVRPGLLLIPAAAFWSVISQFGSDWFSYRIIPYVGLFTIYIVLIIHNLRKGSLDFWPLLLLMTMGPVLYGFVMLRPEILIITVCVCLFVIARCMLLTRKSSVIYIYSFVMLLLFSLITYVHPKALYLFLVLAVSFVMAAAKLKKRIHRIFYVLIFMIATLLIIRASLDMHNKQFLSCGSVSGIAQNMGKQAVNPMDLFRAPEQFKEELSLSYREHITRDTFDRMWFQKSYQSNFLPEKESTNIFDSLADALIETTVIFFIFYVLWKLIACFCFLKGDEERKQFYLIVSIMISLFVPFAFNITESFYEISFFVCSLMVVGLLLWPFEAAFRWPSKINEAEKKRLYFLSALFLSFFIPFILNITKHYYKISLLLFVVMVLAAFLWPLKLMFPGTSKIAAYDKFKPLLSAGFYCYMLITAVLCLALVYCNFTKEFLAGYEGPSQSFWTDRNALDVKIQRALQDEHIAPTEPMIMDDLTYDAVKKHPIVMPVQYLLIVSPDEIKTSLDHYHVRYGVMGESMYGKFTAMTPVKTIATIQYERRPYQLTPGTGTVYLFQVVQ